MSKEQFSESLQEVLKEMCNRVGADYESIDFSSERWYINYSWTLQEEKQFEKWMVDYLYKSAKARREIMNHLIKRKSYLEKVAREFTFMYGWSLAKEEMLSSSNG